MASGSKDRMSRRDFLKGFLPRNSGMVLVDKEKCTGCTLCAIDCPTKALVVRQDKDSYQLLFRQEACDACGVCEKSCPEHCLQLMDSELGRGESGEKTKVLFEDHLSTCVQCGTPLFPRSMVRKLKTKIFANKESWEINLCPSCRIKASFISSPLSPQGEEGKGTSM